MTRKIPNELHERITFMEGVAQSAILTMNGYEARLAELARDRAAIDERERLVHKDNAAAPQSLERARAELIKLTAARRAIQSPTGGGGEDPAKRRIRLERGIQDVNLLRKQLAKVEAMLEEEDS